MFARTQYIADECEQDEAEEQRIKFLEVGEDSSEALRSSELAIDFVASLVHLPVVFPRVVPGLERRNYGREAEVEGQLACRVALVGTIHHQRRVGAPATKEVGELALFRRVVLCLPGGKRERQGRPGIYGNHMKLGGPAAAGLADRLRTVFLAPRPVGMDLDGGAVQRHRLQLEAHDPLPLQLLEDPVSIPFFDRRFIGV